MPVGFKWFVPGLFDGSICFGGEESAGASFLRQDGTVWTTDKDGPIMDLLAAEITARTGKDPGEHYRELTAAFGTPCYTRIDAPATPEQKARLQKLSPEAVKESKLAGEPITAKLTRAPGNSAPIGGLKVVASEWLVRGSPVRHRERLQDLRRELQGREALAGDRGRSTADRERGSDSRRLEVLVSARHGPRIALLRDCRKCDGRGLLHTKSMTADRRISMFGTVNLDMRTLWLNNYEVALFVYGAEFAEEPLQNRHAPALAFTSLRG